MRDDVLFDKVKARESVRSTPFEVFLSDAVVGGCDAGFGFGGGEGGF